MSFFGLETTAIDIKREREAFLRGGLKEDFAVYTWGEENYDGLGDELQEGGDDLNDETFGGLGDIGKDFDFAGTTQEHLPKVQRTAPTSIESLWDEQSTVSVLKPRVNVNGASRYEKVPISGVHTLQDVEAEMRQRRIDEERLQQEQQQRRLQLEQQRQHLLQQEQYARELQEQLRIEDLERQLRAQQISQLNQGPVHFNSYGSRTREYQLQQRLLSEIAQTGQVDSESLRLEAMRKILETEKMEEKRRRKAAKIAHMARYNDLMTQSDKDFITRIQVSQLVTQDPYADDFYAQVYGAILRSRAGQSQDERVLKFGSGLGVGLGVAQKASTRRPTSAMHRMEQQVERIVSNARRREEEKGLHSVHSLQGALGKTSGRSYKAAPRQLLQVEANANANPTATSPTLSHSRVHSLQIHDDTYRGAAAQAARLGREALGNAADTRDLVSKDPLTRREVLVSLETLYDLVLRVEQLRRDQPPLEDEETLAEWQIDYDALVNQIWDEMKVMVPVATSNPHPFISLLSASKGKKILPRITRHLDPQRILTMLTLLIACFNQLDVVVHATLLDTLQESKSRDDVERQTQAFLGSVLQSILPIVVKGNLRLITGLLGLFLDRNHIAQVARTRPGLAMLTLFITRVEVIKQSITSSSDPSELPTVEDANQWQLMFDHLFQLLSTDFLSLFPSTRLLTTVHPGQHHKINAESIDQPVWQFLAALALHAATEQQQILVTALREKVLDNVLTANKGWVVDEDERKAKLANVNLFLHALGLDSSQIAL